MILWIYYLVGIIVVLIAIFLWYKMLNQNRTSQEIIQKEINDRELLRSGNDKKESCIDS